MPHVPRKAAEAPTRERTTTPRSYEHDLVGTVVRMCETETGWRLASESEDYEHAVVAAVRKIRSVEYAHCIVRDNSGSVVAQPVLPVTALEGFIVASQ